MPYHLVFKYGTNYAVCAVFLKTVTNIELRSPSELQNSCYITIHIRKSTNAWKYNRIWENLHMQFFYTMDYLCPIIYIAPTYALEMYTGCYHRHTNYVHLGVQENLGTAKRNTNCCTYHSCK